MQPSQLGLQPGHVPRLEGAASGRPLLSMAALRLPYKGVSQLMSEKWVIRLYKEGEEKSLNDFFCFVFQKQRSLRQWHWEFLENPATANLAKPIIVVAETEGEIIGHASVVPVFLKYKNNTFLVALGADASVRPAFRELKLLVDLVEYAKRVAMKEGAILQFGFPTYYYPVVKRLLRYKDLCSLPILFRRLNWRLALQTRFPRLPTVFIRSIARLSNRCYSMLLALKHGSRESEVVVREVPYFDHRIDSLWDKAKERYEIMLVRNQQFLNWRYAYKPEDPHTILIAEQGHDILGYIVLNVKRLQDATVGFVMDFLALEGSIDALLVKAALRYLLSQEVDYALCRVLREDPVSATLRRYGFWERPEFPPMHGLYHLFSAGVDETFLQDPKNWHLTYGDELDFMWV